MSARSKQQNIVLVIGLTLLGTSIAPELLGWGQPGFGALQMVLTLFGFGATLLGVLPRETFVAGAVRQGILFCGAAYFFFLVCELGLLVVTPYRHGIDPIASLRGSIQPAPWGYDHTPGWRGVFADGVVTAPITINSEGDRDDEPRPNDTRTQILLIGDSVAFGYALPREETIDAHIERSSEGRYNAYNLGTLGYGPSDAAAKLEAATATGAAHVFYIFNGNDLRDDAQPGYYLPFAGFLVPKYRPDGTQYTELDYARHAVAKEGDTTLRKVLSLLGVRRTIARAVQPERDRVMGPLERYRPEGVGHAVEQVKRMHAIARRRGAGFAVMVVPMKGEAAPEEYASPTRSFIDALAAAGIRFVDLHPHLMRTEDYLGHDAHLSASGAGKTARAILDTLEK